MSANIYLPHSSEAGEELVHEAEFVRTNRGIGYRLVYISVTTKIIDHLVRIRVWLHCLHVRRKDSLHLDNAVEASSNIRLAQLHSDRRILILKETRNPYIAHDQIEHKADGQDDSPEQQAKRAAAGFAAAAALAAALAIAARLRGAGRLGFGNILLLHFMLLSNLLLFHLLRLLHGLFAVLLISFLGHFCTFV